MAGSNSENSSANSNNNASSGTSSSSPDGNAPSSVTTCAYKNAKLGRLLADTWTDKQLRGALGEIYRRGYVLTAWPEIMAQYVPPDFAEAGDAAQALWWGVCLMIKDRITYINSIHWVEYGEIPDGPSLIVFHWSGDTLPLLPPCLQDLSGVRLTKDEGRPEDLPAGSCPCAALPRFVDEWQSSTGWFVWRTCRGELYADYLERTTPPSCLRPLS
ncbi:hypothetical protein AJ80_06747 [Polytolypa hystricis UAMH7299]|uniref:Uncharacterized protein n=1 Tax=Polytolypa hystricis (strain UAMH7299) TaxID=1447883 RepID=A0A2B7XV33_POLH7|nr:hypothetical protein AJ80_06747 [Polytolypa hystricis UAMH7299]